MLNAATFLSHSRPLAEMYRHCFQPSTLHLRSNLGEIGRAFYRRRLARQHDRLTPEDLADLWGHARHNRAIVEAFADWAAAVRFDDSAALDPADVFYWEHRMSCWHACLLLESDFAFDTHILFNARTILAKMLAVPLQDRIQGSLFRQLVADLWPELLGWPTGRPGFRRVLVDAVSRLTGR